MRRVDCPNTTTSSSTISSSSSSRSKGGGSPPRDRQLHSPCYWVRHIQVLC
jgi:hypothetical protein